MTKIIICLTLLCISQSLCFNSLPQIPTGRRTQFLILHDNGAYKYGYDTGDGNAAKQSGDTANQVEGHYFYKNAVGQDIDLKYTAGVQGFVPEGLEKVQTLAGGTGFRSANLIQSAPVSPPISHYSASSFSSDDQAGTGDASYAFNIDTDSYKRQEASDARGNIKGSYSYSNEAGVHDLSYTAGENSGFIATSGTLSKANGLKEGQTFRASAAPASGGYSYQAPAAKAFTYQAASATPLQSNPDGSYAYSYTTGDSSHHQAADAGGNVQGAYSYTNHAGSHDLSYVAGSKTGFLVTGGSLAQPNGLGNAAQNLAYTPVLAARTSGTSSFTKNYSPVDSGETHDDLSDTGDSSYNFSVDTDEYKRTETSDAKGNVQGSYSYKNAAGTHDLSYVAGSQTGFVATGGSLSDPNAITAKIAALPYNKQSAVSAPLPYKQPSTVPLVRSSLGSNDASYSFTIDTDEYKRQEASDANGNIQGSYQYRNSAGDHGLNYVAGSATGFQATGGSLSVAPGLTEHQLRSGTQSSGAGLVLAKTYLPAVAKVQSYSAVNSLDVPATSKLEYSLGNVKVRTLLPPSNEKRKFGYVLETVY